MSFRSSSLILSARPRLAALRASLADPNSKTPVPTLTSVLPDDVSTSLSSSSSSLSSIIPYQTFLHPPPPSTQPLTDTHNRLHNYVRLSLTSRCNLRCTYCMPEDGVPLPSQPSMLTDVERYKIIKSISSRIPSSGPPVKIKLTGGEPLLHSTLPPLLEDLSTLTADIGLTTNGILLSKKWDGIKDYIKSVNISLDTVDEEKFERLTRRRGRERVMDSISLASKTHRVKINCVVMRGFNDSVTDFDQILSFCEANSVECRFIEWMPFSGNNFDGKFVSMKEMKETIRKTGREIDDVETFFSDTTKWGETERGRVGFISSMSENFCGGCNRIRVTCDGNLKVRRWKMRRFYVKRSNTKNEFLQSRYASSTELKYPSAMLYVQEYPNKN
ncbi:hypothetical protein TL16_g05926 [Triparma laevis f. inornata]|uniref:GTP 3',8-cyclase n=1 Tax=Triparma laevis f. inornata TaxID=1714386 RepID=A0A9W7EB44_9STRA|nr:hypothetical protein TL16_g05926 [Triparma laevis f. inornata]